MVIVFIVQGKNNILYQDGVLYNSDNTLYTGKVCKYTRSVVQALNDLSTITEGGAIVAELQQSTNNFYILLQAMEHTLRLSMVY